MRDTGLHSDGKALRDGHGHRGWWSVVLLGALLLLGGMPPVAARAADFFVTTTDASGPGSLSAAVSNANLSPDPWNEIYFSASAAGTISLTTDLQIEKDVAFSNNDADAGVIVNYVGMSLFSMSGGRLLRFAGSQMLAFQATNASFTRCIYASGQLSTDQFLENIILTATAIAPTGDADAIGIFVNNGNFEAQNDIAGSILASALATAGNAGATGIFVNNGDLRLNDGFSGDVTSHAESATGSATASGLTVSNGNLVVDHGLNAYIQTSAVGNEAMAFGLQTTQGDILLRNGYFGWTVAMAVGSNAQAYGMLSAGALVVDEAFAGGVGVFAGMDEGTAMEATGLRATGDLTLSAGMTGSIAAYSWGAASTLAYGLYSLEGPVTLGCDLAGQVVAVTVTSGSAATAYGLLSIAGDLRLEDGLSGRVAVGASSTATTGNVTVEAYALQAEAGNLTIDNSGLSGTVEATAAAQRGNAGAVGLSANGVLTIAGGLSGTVTAMATSTNGTASAYGLYAGGAMNGGAADTPLAISGTVSAQANGTAVAVQANGALNLAVTGTLSGVDTSGGGQGYAVKSGAADDSVILGTGASLTGKVDLGTGTNTLTLLGTGAATNQFLGVSNLTAGDGATATAWTLAPTATAASSFGNLNVQTGATLSLNEYVTITGAIADAGSLIFDLAGEGSYAGGLTGQGSLTKTGSGVLALTGNSAAFSGQTTVEGGTLFLGATGSLGGTVTVNQGGTLGGYGTLGNLANNGVVSPGGSIGTLTVAGNYVQGATATLVEEIAADGSGDLLAVGGTANLGGGLLSIQAAPGYYSTGLSWTVLTASGGLTGTFDRVTQPRVATTLVFETAYTDTSVLLQVTRIPYANFAQDKRAAAVGTGLNALAPNASGDMAALLASLDYSTPDTINQTLGKLSPEPLDAFTQGVFDAGRMLTATQFAAVQDTPTGGSQAFSGPLDSGPAAAMGLARQVGPQLALSSSLTGLGASADAASGSAGLADRGFSVFLRPFGMLAHQSAGSERTGYNATTGGLTGGITMQPTPGLTLGLAPGFFSQSVSLKTADGGDGTVNDWSLAVIGAYRHNGWFVDGLARIGYNTYVSHRSIAVANMARTAKGVWSGWNTALAVGTGYDFQVGGFTLGPVASLEWQQVSQDPYSETGAGSLGLKVHGRSDHSLTTTLGGRVYRTFETRHGTVTPEVRLAWGAQWLDSPRSITSSFAGYPQSGFTTKSAHHDYHSAIVDAGVTMNMNERLSVSARVGLELFRPGYDAQAGSLSLKYSF